MARKHAKQRKHQSQPVKKVILKAAIQSKEREAVEVPQGTEGAIEIKQEDGTTKWFVVRFKTVNAEVVKHVATGPTTKYGQKNDPKNMAPKGTKLSKTGPATTGGKK